METRELLQQVLIKSQRALAILEEQRAAYGSLHIPTHLQIELEDKRKEVENLQEQLAKPLTEPFNETTIGTLVRERTLRSALPRQLRIFLCYAIPDKPVLQKLYQCLKSENWIAPWWDEENLMPGQNWQLEIRRAVEQSDIIIVCLSKIALSTPGYVHKIMRQSLELAEEQPEGTIFVIPLKFEECELPESLRQLYAVNYFEENGYKRLLKALELRAITLGINMSPTTKSSVEKLTSEKQISHLTKQLEEKEASENWDSVIRLGEKILRVDQARRTTRFKTSHSYLERGKIYYEEGNYSLALSDFEKAVQLHPNYPEVYFFLGITHKALGNLQDAHEQLEQAITFGYSEAKEELANLDKTLGFWQVEKVLDSPASTARREAARKYLDMRLQQLIENQAGLDPHYITCAEYQLFLDDLNCQGLYFQPDHWTSQEYPTGWGGMPVAGIRVDDALKFCEWLAKYTNNKYAFELPLAVIARQNQAQTFEGKPYQNIATWSMNDDNSFCLIGLSQKEEEQLPRKLGNTCNTTLPLPSSILINPPVHQLDSLFEGNEFSQKLEQATVIAFPQLHSHYLTLDLDFAFSIACSRNPSLDISIAAIRAKVRARDLAKNLPEIKNLLQKEQIQEAYKLINAKEIVQTPVGNLIKCLLEAALSTSYWQARLNWQKYAACVIENIYPGYTKLLEIEPEQAKTIAANQEFLLNLYWWLKKVIACTEGKLVPWEGIRLQLKLS